MLTIGVGDPSRCESLEGFGADQVTPSLGALLDPRLTGALEGGQ
jgi:hypothetical protein